MCQRFIIKAFRIGERWILWVSPPITKQSSYSRQVTGIRSAQEQEDSLITELCQSSCTFWSSLSHLDSGGGIMEDDWLLSTGLLGSMAFSSENQTSFFFFWWRVWEFGEEWVSFGQSRLDG
jgi:hypothetical protein